MGTNAVGGMIVAGPEGFVKNQYRKFNIRSTDITPGDDFGMMREVMQRRFSRLVKEHGDAGRRRSRRGDDEDDGDAGFPAWPDVILIDGGQGQMTAVREILADLGIEDRVVGDRRRQGRRTARPAASASSSRASASFSLPVRDPVLYFVQRLRDEAHRFAIGSHRARRKKEMVKNPLDEIGGIGPARKRALLHAFRHGQGGQPRGDRGSDGGRRHFRSRSRKLVYNHFHESS